MQIKCIQIKTYRFIICFPFISAPELRISKKTIWRYHTLELRFKICFWKLLITPNLTFQCSSLHFESTAPNVGWPMKVFGNINLTTLYQRITKQYIIVDSRDQQRQILNALCTVPCSFFSRTCQNKFLPLFYFPIF